MHDEAQQFQEQTLKYIILGLVVTGIGLGLTTVWIDGFSSPWLLRSLALIVVAFIAYALLKAGHFMIAAYVLVLELIGIVVGLFLQPNAILGITPYLFVPLIIIAGLILNPAAILIISLFAIVLTLIAIFLTGQLTPPNLFALAPPFGLMILSALLVIGSIRFRVKLTNLLRKNRSLARQRTLEMLEAQDKVESLQQRVVNLQQQVLRGQAETVQAFDRATERDSKFYELIQGAIRELDISVKNLEGSIERITKTSKPGEANGFVEEVWPEIDHLTNLAVNLEEMVRLENDEIELHYQTVDVSRLLNELANAARGLVDSKRIAIKCQASEDLPVLQADPDRLRQALLYLVNNAIKYTDEGYIEIQAELNEQEMTIFVSDTGLGMSQEETSVIFEKFGRGTDAASQQRYGAGLGLTICKYLVELHRGRVWNTSVKGLGSTFYLALPLDPVRESVLAAGPNNEEATLLSLPLVELTSSSQPDTPQPFFDPEATVPSPRLEQAPPQPASEPERPELPVLRPSLSPVARFSSTYISRFGLSLLGILVLISIIVAVLALINPPIEDTSANISQADPAIASTNLGGETPVTSTPLSEQIIISTPTLLPTKTPVQIATPTPSPTRLPTETPTGTPTLVPPTPTSSSTPTPLPTPTATSTTKPTATNPPPSPTIVPPTLTVAEVNRTAAVPAALTEPSVAPSTQLSFVVGRKAVALRNLKSKLETGLTINLEMVENSRLAWAPDGKRLLLVGAAGGHREIYLTDVSGSQLKNLTQSPGDDQQPSWSPDGKKIAFSSGRNGNFDIYVMDSDGHNLVQLTNSRGFDEWPVWSPDERKIAFISDRDGGNVDIYLMNVDGSNQQRLTDHAANDGPPVWSPDGSRLVFASERDGNSNLYLIDATSGSLARLTNDPANEQAPVWSPDGRTIAFVANGAGNNDVYIIPAPGQAVTEVPRSVWNQVTDTPEDESFPVWLP